MPTPTHLKVLLVEDDLDIAAGLGDYLEAHGVRVDFAGSCREARARVQAEPCHLLVLDVNLPDGDGIGLCRELRARGLAAPVIFLTASADLGSKLAGFAAGAVDYVVKPFEPAELLARIRAIAALSPAQGGAELQAGDFVLDLHRHLLRRGDATLPLQATAFTVLRELLRAQPGVVSQAALSEAVWGDQAPASEPLRRHVHQLRQALTQSFGAPLVATVRGVGYRWQGLP